MADPFSIASGTAGLITLVTEAIRIASVYTSGSTHAAELRTRLEVLAHALQTLHTFLTSPNSPPQFTVNGGSVLELALDGCRKTLQEVLAELAKTERRMGQGKWKRGVESVKWPWVERGHREVLASVEAFGHTFGLALSVGGCELLSKTSGEVLQTLKSQQETVAKMQELASNFSGLEIKIDEQTRAACEKLRTIQTVVEEISGRGRFLEGVEGAVMRTEGILLEQEKRHSTQKQMEEKKFLIDSLSKCSAEFVELHADVRKLKTPGTGDWFLTNPIFLRWVTSPQNHILWCPGMPGAGKTVITSIAIEYLTKLYPERDVGIAYAHCDYKQEDQTATGLLSVLIGKLVEQLPTIPDRVQKTAKQIFGSSKSNLLRRTTKSSSAIGSVENLTELLLQASACFQQTFVLIDAFDELPETNNNRDDLEDSFSKISSRVKLLVTSRPHQEIENQFFKECPRIRIKARPEDVKTYVNESIGRNNAMRRFVATNPALKEEIAKRVAEKADGMFILARLHMDHLSSQRNIRNLRRALDAMPTSIHDIYDETITRIQIQPSHSVVALKCLSWVFCARQPISSIELQHALAVEPGDVDFEETGLYDVSYLLSITGGLITVSQHGIVRFMHQTVQEYFTSVSASLFPAAESEIATTCLTYLSFTPFHSGPLAIKNASKLHTQIHKLFKLFPLLRYCAEHWGDHVRACQRDDDVFDLALRFLFTHVLSAFAKQLVFMGPAHDYLRDFTPLHEAARLGLDRIVCHLIDTEEYTANSVDMYGDTPMHWVARNGGHPSTAQILLEYGADCGRGNEAEFSALDYAHSWKNQGVLDIICPGEKVRDDARPPDFDIIWTELVMEAQRDGNRRLQLVP